MMPTFKAVALTIVLLTGIPAFGVPPATQPGVFGGLGVERRELMVEGRRRSYLVHRPAGLDAKQPVPFVLAFHGALMNAAVMVPFCGLNRKADEAGFVVVYPNGMGLGEGMLVFNASAEAKPDGPADDVAFTRAMLDDLATFIDVDPHRVFATGMSNGGMMCHRLGAELSDRIAAIAPVAGTLALPAIHPKRAVPVIHFHGTGDRIVPWNGPRGFLPTTMQFQSVDETIKAWVAADGCVKDPVTVEYAKKVNDGTGVKRLTYGSGDNGAEVVLIEVRGGGHTWPGRDAVMKSLGNSTKVVSANDLIWEFFLKHPMK